MKDASTEGTDLSALSALAPELAATMARVASDIALVIDPEGVIRAVAEGAAPLSASCAAWVGRHWVDTVTHETRSKIEQLLDEVRATGVTKRREVSHPSPDGDDVPVAWSAIRLGIGGPVVAVGRDMRAVAAIQQRFLDAQQELERDYWRRRQAESRYRLLFQVASDAVLVLDAPTGTVLDANDAALTLFGDGAASLVGRPLADSLPAPSLPAIAELLATARTTGRAGEIRVRLAAADLSAYLSATPFRVGDRQQLLVRARRDDARDPLAGGATVAASEFVEQTPDAIVITDSGGRVVFANRAFVTLLHQGSEAALKGRPLSEIVGDPDGSWRALIGRTRSQGIVTRSTLSVRLPGGSPVSIDATSALMAEGEQECLGFTLRPAAPSAVAAVSPAEELFQGLSEVTGQVGRLPLAELLLEVQHLAERHLIESAVLRAGGLAPVAAELLGLTQESLLWRMRRHGLSLRSYSGPEGPSRAIN